jgi:hypothetical protein
VSALLSVSVSQRGTTIFFRLVFVHNPSAPLVCVCGVKETRNNERFKNRWRNLGLMMLRCVQLVRRAPGSLSRLVAVRWDSSSTGRGDVKRTKDPRVTQAAPQRSQRSRAVVAEGVEAGKSITMKVRVEVAEAVAVAVAEVLKALITL